jgi:hypothetical protein
MGRAELLARMDSRELTGFAVLLRVQHEEREEAAEEARHRAESKDGEVVYHNRPTDSDDEDPDDDGPAQ